MDKTRLDLLREMVQNRPDDTFARYGLAMELSTSGDPEGAWLQFDHLLAHHAEYAPAYYQAGKLLVSQGRRDEARRVLEKGIEVTGRQGNLHAQSELQAAFDQLGEQ